MCALTLYCFDSVLPLPPPGTFAVAYNAATLAKREAKAAKAREAEEAKQQAHKKEAASSATGVGKTKLPHPLDVTLDA